MLPTPKVVQIAKMCIMSLPRQGRLAQLGERCSHIAEVTGSSPVSPTNHQFARCDQNLMGRFSLEDMIFDRHCSWLQLLRDLVAFRTSLKESRITCPLASINFSAAASLCFLSDS